MTVLTVSCMGTARADVTKVTYATYTNGGYQLLHEPVRSSAELLLSDNVYEVQQDTSTMSFRVDTPLGDVWASFDEFDGRFTMTDADLSDKLASVEVNTASLETGAGLVGMLLRGEKFFDVENFPAIRFVGHSLEWYKEKHAVLKGELTIKNVTKQVAFYLRVIDADIDGAFSERITVEASTTIRRTEFGIFSLLPAVSDNVNLFMTIDAVKMSALSMK